MPVIPIDSKLPFKFRRPRPQGKVPRGVKLLIGAAFVFWGPPVLYSVIIHHALPFFVLLYTQILGVLLGIHLYLKQSNDNLSCVPANYVPKFPRAASAYKRKDAA
jgi:hypothetical protein